MTRVARLICIVALLAVCSVGVLAAEDMLTWDLEVIQAGALPEAFIVKKGEPIVAVAPVGDTKAVRLSKAEEADDGVLVPFGEVNDRVVIEFAAYTPSQERNLVVIVGKRAEGATSLPTNQGVYLSFMPRGAISYYSRGWSELGTLNTTQWNQFRIEVDIPFEAFTVYMNGSKLGVGSFRGSVDTVDTVEFSMFTNAGTGTVWVDEIAVSPGR